MILPIVLYGGQALRTMCRDIKAGDIDIKSMVGNMFDTMYNASGVGLAAPQVGMNISLFIVDSTPLTEDVQHTIKQVFINPTILSFSEEQTAYNEGCLSIPGIHREIIRPEYVEIAYLDENFKPCANTFNGINARIIQHEYDHLKGKLFIDYLSPSSKILMKNKLNAMSKNKKWDYPTTV